MPVSQVHLLRHSRRVRLAARRAGSVPQQPIVPSPLNQPAVADSGLAPVGETVARGVDLDDQLGVGVKQSRGLYDRVKDLCRATENGGPRRAAKAGASG